MSDCVSFHLLRRKFLEQDKDIPEPEAVRNVMYYSLAIGHHVGVIDCLEKIFELPAKQYSAWIAHLPEGRARQKMAGLLIYGEIHIDSSHVGMLGEAWSSHKNSMGKPFQAWTLALLKTLAAIVREPAVYLVVKMPGRVE